MSVVELDDEECATLIALLAVSERALRLEYDRDPQLERLTVWLAVADLLTKVEDACGMVAQRKSEPETSRAT